nr:MAG TPA_asm: hypothetical protein [Caudoviricetes sp.]
MRSPRVVIRKKYHALFRWVKTKRIAKETNRDYSQRRNHGDLE